MRVLFFITALFVFSACELHWPTTPVENPKYDVWSQCVNDRCFKECKENKFLTGKLTEIDEEIFLATCRCFSRRSTYDVYFMFEESGCGPRPELYLQKKNNGHQ